MAGSRVYIGGLPRRTRERDLEKFFVGYGRICDIVIKNGYGFVEFEDNRDADDAVYEKDGKDLLGERVSVEPAKGRSRGGGGRRDFDRRGGRSDKFRDGGRFGPPKRSKYRLIVENLSSRVSWQDLKDYIRKAGEVTFADAQRPRKNEGVVEFASRSDMERAITELNDTELNGRRIRLIEDCGGREKRGRSRSRSNSRSRSRSRRRSRSKSRRSSRSRSDSRYRSKSPKKSRSRDVSEERNVKSKTRGGRDRNGSRSRSRSNDSRDGHQQSQKRGNKSRSRSRSKSERRSRHRSESKDNKRRSRSRSADHRSRSRSAERRSHSRSKSNEDKRRSRSVSDSRSRSRSKATSPAE
ncbi:serine/arginine-rich splicing factor 5-like [Toxorhynchites rutilus septentrionalis]|uniref:serine/arginine-rich splicing factor 5-like n=1 Tax=Toxorhynchites rutilus septentrionalis TaxID=329112 RepID=UPI002478F76B|nr:serine/arginine-rich splicing factor 5-like [Toxorhynchites rutilus septentrionalis]